MRYMEIIELKSGKRHYRKIKHDCSIRYGVEGAFLVVRDYNTGNKLQRFYVGDFGSIQFSVIYK